MVRRGWWGSLALLTALASCSGRQTIRASKGTSLEPVQSARIVFREVTDSSGLRFRHEAGARGKKYLPETMGAGCAFIDYDGDGWLDAVLLNGTEWQSTTGTHSCSALFLNRHGGMFDNVTARAGLDAEMYAMGCGVGDYDNDGFDDLYVTTAIGPNRLFHNRGDGTFEDRTRVAGVGSTRWGTSCTWLDYDRDGWLDLFVCNYVKWTPQTDRWCGFPDKAYCRPQEYPGDRCQLYRNRRDGTFEDVSAASGIASAKGKSLGVVALDADHDGWDDLAVANDTEPSFLFLNRRNGTFRESALESGIALADDGTARAGMGIDAADFDSDGRWCLLIGNFVNEGLACFRKTSRRGEFQDVAAEAGMLLPSMDRVTFAVGYVDFDLDGDEDAFAVNGHIDDHAAQTPVGHAQRMLILQNRGAGKFRDVSARAGPAIRKPLVGRGAAWGDYDADGDLDLLVTECMGSPRLLRNDTKRTGHWLRLHLIGHRSNRNGIGAKVTIKLHDGRVLTKYVRGDGSYLSGRMPGAHFGLAGNQIDSLECDWPSGTRTTTRPAKMDAVIRLRE